MKIKNSHHARATFIILLLLLLASVESTLGNDSGAEMGASGLQFKEEKNISMEREDLYISQEKIEVTYAFKNHSDSDITIEIAFPVPEYTAEDAQRGLPFDDFMVEVNGNKIKYNSEIHALVNGKDYSKLLKKMGISIHDFGGHSHPLYKDFYRTLSRQDQKTLRKYGLVTESGYPYWTVSIKHHWTQTFPANSTTAVKHTYTPWWGYFYFFTSDPADTDSFIKKACGNPDVTQWIRKQGQVFVNTVAYILTTARNWRGPIKEFHLVIEKKKHQLVSLCFDGKLNRISDTKFESYIKDYIPKQNLMVYYLYK
jgi:hypothetical protein